MRRLMMQYLILLTASSLWADRATMPTLVFAIKHSANAGARVNKYFDSVLATQFQNSQGLKVVRLDETTANVSGDYVLDGDCSFYITIAEESIIYSCDIDVRLIESSNKRVIGAYRHSQQWTDQRRFSSGVIKDNTFPQIVQSIAAVTVRTLFETKASVPRIQYSGTPGLIISVDTFRDQNRSDFRVPSNIRLEGRNVWLPSEGRWLSQLELHKSDSVQVVKLATKHYAELIDRLSNSGLFTLVERERITRSQREVRLSETGLTDSRVATAAMRGNLVGDYILVGSIEVGMYLVRRHDRRIMSSVINKKFSTSRGGDYSHKDFPQKVNIGDLVGSLLKRYRKAQKANGPVIELQVGKEARQPIGDWFSAFVVGEEREMTIWGRKRHNEVLFLDVTRRLIDKKMQVIHNNLYDPLQEEDKRLIAGFVGGTGRPVANNIGSADYSVTCYYTRQHSRNDNLVVEVRSRIGILRKQVFTKTSGSEVVKFIEKAIKALEKSSVQITYPI